MSEQLALFADKSSEPEGLRYAAEFISPAFERELIGHISALPLQPFQFGAYEGKRRVASFGFRYTLRRLKEAGPIPGWLRSVIGMVETFGGPPSRIEQVLCTEDDIGVGIGWHRTSHISTGSSGFRWGRPANSVFAENSTTNGSASRSMQSHGRFI